MMSRTPFGAIGMMTIVRDEECNDGNRVRVGVAPYTLSWSLLRKINGYIHLYPDLPFQRTRARDDSTYLKI